MFLLHLRQSAYSVFLKPFFLSLDPETAHELAKNFLGIGQKFPGFLTLMESMTSYQSDRLKTKIAGIEFENPLGMGAGFDKTGELYPFLSRMGFGHIEVGTITGQKQSGNPKPRVFRYPQDQALVNRMGFNNPGADSAEKIISSQKKTKIRGINAGKTKIVPEEKAVEDYVYTLKKLSPYADYAVINISSPNTPGLRNFQKQENFVSLIQGIRKDLGKNFKIPLFVKFAPDMETKELEALLETSLSLKINGVILTNTTIDKSCLKNYPNVEKEGGLSGTPLKNRSTEFVRIAYRILKRRIPIIGVGGIDSEKTALEKILAGADLIQIYTGYIYQGPFLPMRILKFLDRFLEKQDLKTVSDLVGKEKEIRLDQK
ncbi:quinone-dependent dihydroorotate dehydrogenase [Leptospira interrogans]|uniref:Dihydroorotate dehydrogenase (quinone) n=2 Tax=Leptospira interrogans TaxID=173 RepID=A0A0F6IA76_LEPIR|nr:MULTISPECIES: quinone-dependent dihydroorotate dehydrogenase [Leptospira]EJO78823.1 dihydroorotate dehydrogenase (fumarate) [Leptospira interrogans serovar Pomona str. Kennewicki LC82-25]EKN97916.1 dihydroorotate dehydrogenase (fumarate) [Leptospira interrogans serovar Pomona str. Pomona]EKR84230.1 dihydroorotate dehydrogenase (fumarate) [Leptospira interrogans str. UI 08452]EMF34962.1 dihydroorotate dehydrogenase (fumarate) [Leptospira interrogans serovar Pomona str. Fox 32256]EMI62559.1 d